MEAVDVFIRRDALENFDVIDPCRQGQLNQNTVDGLIGIQSVDKLQQLGFAGGFREIVRAGDEAHFFTCFALAAGKRAPGLAVVLVGSNASLHFFRNLRAYLLRNRFTVNNFCCHQREDSICIFTKGG